MHNRSYLLTSAAVAVFAAATSSAECTREGLLAAAESYLAAQTTGKPSTLSLTSTNFTYLQNNRVSDIATGLLSVPFVIDFNRSTADTAACSSYTMWISTSANQPHVVGTQIRHADNDTSIISSIDTVAATTGDLFFDAAKTLSYIRAETWATLPALSQPSRGLLRSIGDAYLDMWTNATAADTVPWGTQCERVEGSIYTSPCGGSLPHGGSQKVNGMRRYIIDETVGSVQVSCQFDSLGPWPDSHEIRVEGGKVRYVHTVTVLRGVGA